MPEKDPLHFLDLHESEWTRENPPKDWIEAGIDIFVLAAGMGLLVYLKAYYAADIGNWLLSLVGYQGP